MSRKEKAKVEQAAKDFAKKKLAEKGKGFRIVSEEKGKGLIIK